jgi:hypothetical protein
MEDQFVAPAQTAITTRDMEWEAYLNKQANLSTSRTPSPCGIKFHGDKGTYSLSYFDAASKETKFQDVKVGWSGVILAVRWFAKWKYDPNASQEIKTREFSMFRDEPISLLTIDKQNRQNVPTEENYFDYSAFKAAYAMPVPKTDKIKYPFDLFASVYVYAPDVENPVGAKVLRYRFSGTTRSAFFDYMKTCGLTGVLTTFGTSEPQLKPTKGQDGKDEVYYIGSFSSSEVPTEMRKGVMQASDELNKWFQSWKQKTSQAEVSSEKMLTEGVPMPEMLPVKDLDQDMNIEDIPFGN